MRVCTLSDGIRNWPHLVTPGRINESNRYFHAASIGQILLLPRAAPSMPSIMMSAVASRNLMKWGVSKWAWKAASSSYTS